MIFREEKGVLHSFKECESHSPERLISISGLTCDFPLVYLMFTVNKSIAKHTPIPALGKTYKVVHIYMFHFKCAHTCGVCARQRQWKSEFWKGRESLKKVVSYEDYEN